MLAWTERAYAAVPLPPVLVGAAILVILLLAFGISELVLGRFALLVSDQAGVTFWRNTDQTLRSFLLGEIRIAIAQLVLAAYEPVVYVYLLRGYRRVIHKVWRDTDCTVDEVQDRLARIGHYSRAARLSMILIGLLLDIWTTRAVTSPDETVWVYRDMIPEVVWHRVVGLWIGPWGGLISLAGMVEGYRLTSLVEHVQRVDLLDLRSLRPFTYQALLQISLFAGVVGFVLLTIGGFQNGWFLMVLSWTFWAATLVASMAFSLLPVHRVILKAKEKQLDWCRDALIEAREKLQHGLADESHIDKVIAYRKVVEGVSTWPREGVIFARLTMLIPFGSFAERLIGVGG